MLDQRGVSPATSRRLLDSPPAILCRGAHAADRARHTWSWARGSLSRPFDQITSAGRNFYEWYARARFRPDFEFVVGRIKAMLAIELDMNYGQTGSNDGGGFPGSNTGQACDFQGGCKGATAARAGVWTSTPTSPVCSRSSGSTPSSI